MGSNETADFVVEHLFFVVGKALYYFLVLVEAVANRFVDGFVELVFSLLVAVVVEVAVGICVGYIFGNQLPDVHNSSTSK